MIGDVSAAGLPSASPSSSPASGPPGVMGRDDFLQLLVAQLQNQDPLSPTNPEEFASQLAQFSSLEQLLNIEDSLEEQQGLQEAVLREIHGTSALELVGSDVRATGGRLQVGGESDPTLALAVGGEGARVRVTLVGLDGVPAATKELGWLAPGRHDLAVDELAPELEDGSYVVEVEAVSDAGAPVDVSTLTSHRIDGVRWGPDGPVLLSGSFEIPLGDVVEAVRP